MGKVWGCITYMRTTSGLYGGTIPGIPLAANAFFPVGKHQGLSTSWGFEGCGSHDDERAAHVKPHYCNG